VIEDGELFRVRRQGKVNSLAAYLRRHLDAPNVDFPIAHSRRLALRSLPTTAPSSVVVPSINHGISASL
jgi:hypothetical protein